MERDEDRATLSDKGFGRARAREVRTFARDGGDLIPLEARL